MLIGINTKVKLQLQINIIFFINAVYNLRPEDVDYTLHEKYY